MGGRYRIVRHNNGRLVLKERRTRYLVRSLGTIAGCGIFLLIAVPVVLANFSLDGPFRVIVSVLLAVLFVLLPLVASVGALFRSLTRLLSPLSWEFDRETDRILKKGRQIFGASQVSHISICRALGARPSYSLVLNMRDPDHVTLDQVRDLETLRPVAEALSSALGVRVAYPGDGDSIEKPDQERFVIINPRISIWAAFVVGTFFSLWYALVIPAFVGTIVAGNPFLATFVLIFVVVPLIGAVRFLRGVKGLFRAENWVFDRPANSVTLNNKLVAGFHEISELQLNTIENEGVEHELVLVRSNGKRIVVTHSNDSGIDIARQASDVSRITGLEIVRNASWRDWRDAVRSILSG